MVYGYIRVSSDKQTVENQRYEINRFATANSLIINSWIDETISGTKNYDKRKLGNLLDMLQEGDLIICSELSRLGRSLFMIMEILNICMGKGCKVWTVKDGYRLGDDIQSKVLAFAFGLSAEIERNLISQRTAEALARKRAEGVVLGRPVGAETAINKMKCHQYHKSIIRMISEKTSYSEMARRLSVNRATIALYINRLRYDMQSQEGYSKKNLPHSI